MSVITESSLRSDFRLEIPKEYVIEEDSIITPSAREFLREKRVNIVSKIQQSKNKEVNNEYPEFKEIANTFKPKFVSNYDGGMYEEKPECMTHIHGNRLVFKDENRIIFRGKIDSLQAKFLRVQYNIINEKQELLSNELEEILIVLRNVLRAEVLEEKVEEVKLFGLSFDEIQKHSHSPQKYYKTSHFLPSVSMGLVMIGLNELRTEVREVEIFALKAFRNGLDVQRKDIIQTLNRMSSAVYVLMCRYKSNYYDNVKR